MQFICLFVSLLDYRKFFTDEYCRSGYFPQMGTNGRSVSLRMNTIASYDQFKPIRIRKNLVVNYNS